MYDHLFEGLVTSVSKNKPEQWNLCKDQLLGRIKKKDDVHIIDQKKNRKFEHAVVFIKLMADSFAETGYMDSVPVGETNAATRPEVMLGPSNVQVVKYLPYDKPIEAFMEYENYYREEEQHLSPFEKRSCGITVFREALASLNKEIKLRTARGAFETCSICNNLNDILKNTKLKWSKDQLAIVLKLKKLHLEQQAAERRDASLRKLKAKTSFIGSKFLFLFII